MYTTIRLIYSLPLPAKLGLALMGYFASCWAYRQLGSLLQHLLHKGLMVITWMLVIYSGICMGYPYIVTTIESLIQSLPPLSLFTQSTIHLTSSPITSSLMTAFLAVFGGFIGSVFWSTARIFIFSSLFDTYPSLISNVNFNKNQ